MTATAEKLALRRDDILRRGVLAQRDGRLPEAQAHFAEALRLDPRSGAAAYLLAKAYAMAGQQDVALAGMLAGRLQMAKQHGELSYHLAKFVYELAGPTKSSIAALRDVRSALEGAEHFLLEAMQHDPDLVIAWHLLGQILHEQGRTADADACWDRLMAAEAPDDETRFVRAFVSLGRATTPDAWRAAWTEYEARWKCVAFAHCLRPEIVGYPRWTGGPLAGGTLVIWGEQGVGDCVQFSRYVDLARWRAGRPVVLVVGADILPLMARLCPDADVRPFNDALPRNVKAQVPLLSLPWVLDIPEPMPPRYPAWTPHDRPVGQRRIGVAWAGNPAHVDDRRRSWRHPAPLIETLAAGGDTLVSLQVGPGAADAEALGLEVRGLTSWTETADLMLDLDAVVAVDTGAAHVAATLGVPTHVLLPTPAEWRWRHYGVEGEQGSPWYPSVTLHRQALGAGWPSVLPSLRAVLSLPAPLVPAEAL